MIGFALLLAGATLAVGTAAAVALRRVPTLGGQVAALGIVSVVLPLAAVLASGAVMFSSGHDVVVLAIACAAAATALVGAAVLRLSITRPLERLRTTSTRLASGELSARAREEGPAELRELAGAFNEMAAGLERLFEGRRDLFAWASHDLRTPLAAMQAMLEARIDGVVPADHYLPELREQVVKLGRLVDDLFELARLDSGALELELVDARLAPVVEACVRALRAEAAARRVRIESATTGADPKVRCAPDKVERVLFNLLTNALRHTPADGTVAVRLDAAADEVQVTVDDSGTGLRPEALERAFDPFWRGDPARSGDGAGIGLAIARALVEEQGGRIWATRRPGGGARFCFTLRAA